MDINNQSSGENNPNDVRNTLDRYSEIINSDRPRAKRVATSRKKRSAKRMIKRSLFKEYVRHWYVIVISIMAFFPAYMLEILLGNLFIAKNIPPFLAALLTMFVGGFIATLPFLALNIYLIAKKKKYYAIAVQIIVMEIIGIVFYVYSKIALMLS